MIKMNHELTKQQIEEIRENYPPGTRIELIHMDDQYAVPAGTHGSVNYVDDAGQIHIVWDNGRSLAIVPQVDNFRKLTPQEIQKEQEQHEQIVSIREITTDQLRRMEDQEGLILQGCGGELREWVDGINQMLTEQGILKKGARFEEVYSFQHDGLTCLLFPLQENVKMDVGKLAMWRISTYEDFGGTWLSDYVPNRLGGFARDQPVQGQEKPDCPLIGQNGNIYNLMGIAGQTLRERGMEEQAKEMFQRITQCQSYDSALSVIGDYVNITSVEKTNAMGMKME